MVNKKLFTSKKLFCSIFFMIIGMTMKYSDLSALEWVNVDPVNPVKTVFFQGIFDVQAQAAKLMGKRGFTATTGEHVVCLDKSIEAIHTISVAPEIQEVVLDTSLYGLVKTKGLLAALRLYPLYKGFYVRGIINNYINGIQVMGKKNKRETVKGYAIAMTLMNIGQEGDIEAHQEKMAVAGSCDKILYGPSRGAGVSFVSYALNHALPDYKKVKLVVLEGVYDTIEHVIRERHSAIIAKYPWLENFFYDQILHRFTKFKRSGISPLSVVAEFPHDTPALFVTSAADTNVSSVCAKNLAHALVHSGHKQVYLCELKKSSHCGYSYDDPEDAHAYQVCLHTIYKHYNLPHIEAYAVGSVKDYLVS